MARGLWKELSNRAALVLSNLVELSGRATPRLRGVSPEILSLILEATRPFVDRYGQIDWPRFHQIMKRLNFPHITKGTIGYNRIKWWVEKQHGRFSIDLSISSKLLYDRIFSEISPEALPPKFKYHIRLRDLMAAGLPPITPDQINYHIRELKKDKYLIDAFTERMLIPGQKMPVYPGWKVTKKAIDWYLHYRGPRPGWPIAVPPIAPPPVEPPVTPPRFYRVVINFTFPPVQPWGLVITSTVEIGTPR